MTISDVASERSLKLVEGTFDVTDYGKLFDLTGKTAKRAH
jgi:hypothetical protein